MLNRCYNEKDHIKRPSYKECSVCEDWKYFSNFRDWMSNQKWEGMHLDKDLIDKGNKVYSKDTCMFIPPKINSFIINKNSNGLLEGVGWVKASSCFGAKCSNPLTKKNVSIGFYTDEYVAHIVWKNYKLSLIPYVCEDIENSTFIKKCLEKYYSLSSEEKQILENSSQYRVYGKTKKKEEYRVYRRPRYDKLPEQCDSYEDILDKQRIK